MNSLREQLLESAGLRVRFCWRGDRYAHEIWRLDRSDWVCALASIEGSPQDDWPSSPPFQSLHIDQLADGTSVALLVGMAGKSHWSASVQIDPVSPCVCFDVACRVRDAQVGPLGGAYQTRADCPNPTIELESAPPFAAARVERDGGLIRVAAAGANGAKARTIRWGYRLWPAGGKP